MILTYCCDIFAEEARQPFAKDHDRGHSSFARIQEVGRWYLRDDEIDNKDAAESVKEDAAAGAMEAFVSAQVKSIPTLTASTIAIYLSITFTRCKDKPRRPLAEWLLDYFYKTETGTYRLPASKEEEHLKAEGRAKGINRRIKRYVAYLQQGLAVPEKEQPNDATLVEWIRHCKRSGLYEQGKLLYERGGLKLEGLPEEVVVNLEEDYQVCMRALARAGRCRTKSQTVFQRIAAGTWLIITVCQNTTRSKFFFLSSLLS